LDIAQAALDGVKKELPNVTTVKADLTNWEETKNAVTSLGPFDHLVNNAAVAKFVPFLDITEKHLEM